MRLWDRWLGLLDQREAGTSLALFRILVGVAVLWLLLLMLPYERLELIWLPRADGGYRERLYENGLVALLGGARRPVILTVYVLGLLSSLALLVGLYSRLAALLALQAVLGLAWLNMHAGGSYDDLATNALWLLVLARADTTLSLRCRWRTGSWTSDEPVPAWPRGLVILQLVLMYAGSGGQKVSHHWVPGGDASALYYILLQPEWQRFPIEDLSAIYPLTQVATTLTWLWEVGSPLLLVHLALARRAEPASPRAALLRRLDPRLPFALLGLGLHLGVLAAMEVGPFSPLSLAFYPALFSPSEWSALADRLRRGIKGR